MKKLFLLSLFFISILNTTAQNWLTDINEAKQVASQNNQKIILVFQGSDWCAPCIKLDREIWSTNEFKTYADDNYVMLQADFPRKKKNSLSDAQQEKNNKLAETYNKNGYFPFVVILDDSGNVLGEMGYLKISPNEYIAKINTFSK